MGMNSFPNRHDSRSSIPAHWKARYERIAVIARELGRLPRRSDDVDPADVVWIADQRRSNSLSFDQQRALAQLPGWSEGTRDGAWYERAEELRRFLIVHHRAPRVRSNEPAERALAHWHSRQRVAASRGQLSRDRLAGLKYVTRGIVNS